MEFNIGTGVLLCLRASKLTQTDLARKIGTYPNYICDICANNKRPGLQMLIRIAKGCNVNLSTLIYYCEINE